jgi:hypothetical protein
LAIARFSRSICSFNLTILKLISMSDQTAKITHEDVTWEAKDIKDYPEMFSTRFRNVHTVALATIEKRGFIRVLEQLQFAFRKTPRYFLVGKVTERLAQKLFCEIQRAHILWKL